MWSRAMWRGQPETPPWIARRPQTQRQPARCWSGGGNLPVAPEAGWHVDRVACDLRQSLFDNEGERDFSVADRHLIIEIERHHELAEHRSLADWLQAAAAGRDEGSFLKHVAGAADRAIPVPLVERPGVAIDEPMPNDTFRRPQ